MNLNEFTNDRLPFQYGEILPKDCTKHEIPMGAVPDEKDNTTQVYYMDEIFAAGSEEPVPPVPPVPPTPEVTIFHYEDGTTSESEDTELTQESYDREKVLTSVEIGNSVTSIGNYAFAGCTGLTSVTIGNSVSVIGEAAFNQCAGLTSIIIPESVTSIGYKALGCSTTTDIYFKSLTPVPLVDGEGNIIEMCNDGSSDPSCVNAIYVPESVVDTYKTFDDGWESYADKIQGYTPE